MITSTYSYHVGYGVDPKKISELAGTLEYSLLKPVKIEYSKGNLIITCYDSQVPDYVSFTVPGKSEGLDIPIGYGRSGLAVLDISSDSHCYILVGGVQGSGKSNWLNQVIYTLCHNYTKDDIKMVLIDLKLGVEFSEFEDYPNMWKSCNDPEDKDLVFDLISDLNAEIRTRMGLLKEAGVKKISEYRRIGGSMPYIFMVVDEYAFLHDIRRYSHKDKEYDSAENRVKHLLQIGRAAGLRSAIATQRPTKDSLDTTVKALMTDRICFKVADESNSRVILDVAGAERLPQIPGRCLFQSGFELQELQVMKYTT